MLEDVERAYPSEGCGLILRGPQGLRVRPMRNAYDELKRRASDRFPRTSATAYQFDPKEWLRASMEADDAGEQILCVYHSHVNVGAYFSAEDRLMAAPEGSPLLPAVSYLVVAVDSGRATQVRLFVWSGQDFAEASLPGPLDLPYQDGKNIHTHEEDPSH
jgi:proteasome lid subunit RPN8/RPN11